MGVPIRVTVNGDRSRPRGRAAAAARPLPARQARADRHARRLRHVQLRRLHRPPRRPGGQELHGARGAGRRRRRHDDRGDGEGRRAAPDAGGVLGQPRPPVRLLHAGHDHGRQPTCSSATRTRPRRRSARRSRATSAAARATTTSSRRCSRPASTRRAGVPSRRPQGRTTSRSEGHERRHRQGHRRQRLGRPGDPAQGGPAADHRAGHATSTTSAARDAATRRSCARPRRTRRSLDRHLGGRGARRTSSRCSPART